MRPKEYDVLMMAIEQGVQRGITRLFKHQEKAALCEDELRESRDQLIDAVSEAISEWFLFDDEEGA